MVGGQLGMDRGQVPRQPGRMGRGQDDPAAEWRPTGQREREPDQADPDREDDDRASGQDQLVDDAVR